MPEEPLMPFASPRPQSGRHLIRPLLIAGSLALGGATSAASAADAPQPSSNFPLRVEDGTVTETGTFKFYLPARYEHQEDGTDLLMILPQLKYGFGEVFEVELQV